jgi:hypothetical protein
LKLFYLVVITALTLNTVYANDIESDYKSAQLITNIDQESDDKINPDIISNEDTFKGGFNSILPFIKPAPYQENAGSCLFMSHTGAIEFWMNKLNPGHDLDLSERFFMNLAKDKLNESKVKNWRTDTIYRLNKLSKTYLNEDFPFTKGWYKTGPNGKRIKAQENEDKAFYGVKYNWVIDYKNLNAPSIKLPIFDREVLYKDSKENQWNVGTAPKDAVQRVKEALKKRNAPVLVIYNHTGFWHATLVIGYNDKASTKSCPFVSNYKKSMDKRAAEIDLEAKNATNAKTRSKLERKAAKFRLRGNNVHNAYLKDGGCSDKGIFYVRDSIYPSKSMPIYDYDPANTGEEQHLNAKVILREYEWLKHVSNHAIQIYVK